MNFKISSRLKEGVVCLNPLIPVIAGTALLCNRCKGCCVVHGSVDPYIIRPYRRCGFISALYKFSNVFAGKNFLNFQRIPVALATLFAMLSICDL